MGLEEADPVPGGHVVHRPQVRHVEASDLARDLRGPDRVGDGAGVDEALRHGEDFGALQEEGPLLRQETEQSAR